jgi:hypothetical protein
MSRPNIVLAGVLSAIALAVPLHTGAQTPTPSPARLATLEARNISGISGSVQMTPQGSGTMVNVTFYGPVPVTNQLTLMNGAECSETTRRAETTIPLKNINGTTSSTLVAIPFGAFMSGHFIVDVRDATSRAQLLQACARL